MTVAAIGNKPGVGPSSAKTESRLSALEARLTAVDAKLRAVPGGWSAAAKAQRGQLQAERAGIAAQLSTLNDGPKIVTESRAMTQLRALPAPYRGEADPAQLGNELFERTLGRVGTDEGFVFQSLELAHARGEVPQLNAALGAKMRAAAPGVDQRPEVKNHPQDGYVRLMIAQELSGSEAQRALDYLETGADRFGSSAGSYVAEGLVKAFDDLGDHLHDQPVKTAAMIAGSLAVGAAAAAVAPVVAAAAGVGMLALAGGKVLKNGYEAATATNPAERAENLIALGGAIADTAVSSVGTTGSIKTLSAAASAASGARSAGEAAFEFLSYGSKLKGAQVSVSAVATKAKEIAESAANEPTLTEKLAGALGVDVSDVKLRVGGKVEFSAGGQRYVVRSAHDHVMVEQLQNGLLISDRTTQSIAQRLAANATAKAGLAAPAFGSSPLGQKLATTLGAEVSNVTVRSPGTQRFVAREVSGKGSSR